MAGVQNDVRRAYFELVAAERGVQLATDARVLAVRVRDAAGARLAAGAAPQQEERQAQLNLFEAENEASLRRAARRVPRPVFN